MLIYQNTTDAFILHVRHNMIADIMAKAFVERWGCPPGMGELASWQNSLSRVRDLIEIAELRDNRIALEYEVPYNQGCRIDCLLFGRANNRSENIVLIELKQWTTVAPLSDEGNFVETFTGGHEQTVPHPSQQVKGYDNYLRAFITEFETEPPLVLFSCAYCHNYTKEADTGLFHPAYKRLIDEFPLFAKDDLPALAQKIKTLLSAGNGTEVFGRFMRSPVRPSKKLLEHVSDVVKNEVVFSLLNEQLVAKNLIWSAVRRGMQGKTKSVVIVHGGPGTGKSLIAINVLAEAAHDRRRVFFGCKSKPFTQGLRKLVGGDAGILFSNLYRFVPARVGENELDLLLVDEAHRIEKKSNHQHTRPADRTDMPQVDQLVRCARTSVFFIDDKQNVRSQEIGSSEMIRGVAERWHAAVSEVTLQAQYRCMGSDDYLQWVEATLGYNDAQRILRKNEIFDFRILDSPRQLYDELSRCEKEKANSARLVAGFCWPWSRELDANGDLVKDVKIGDFAMPWETPDEITKLPKGYVRWYDWAIRPEGFKQVGCIYTAQGFEFDYVGVIVGDDLAVDPKTKRLCANFEATEDPMLRHSRESFETHIKNIYRTLLTRGMKGCYAYFTNKATEQFFRDRIET